MHKVLRTVDRGIDAGLHGIEVLVHHAAGSLGAGLSAAADIR